MKLHAFIFACLVLGARAASISSQADGELEKSQDVNQAIVDKAETNLRNVVEIPVGIIEEQMLINKDDNVPDIKESTGVKNAEMDLTKDKSENLNNEMETDIVKQKIEQIRGLINKYDKSVSKMLESPAKSNEDIAVLQREVQIFKNSFSEQLADLRSTIETYINTHSTNLKTQLNSDDIPNQESIHTNLSKLKNNFDTEMTVVSGDFDLLFTEEAIKRKDDSTSDSTTSTTAATTTSTTSTSTTSTTAGTTTNISQTQLFNTFHNHWNNFMTNINTHVNNIHQNWIQNYYVLLTGNKS